MWQLPPAWSDEAALARAWREARPFAHLVVDDFVPADALPGLLEILEEEAVDRYEGDIFTFDATAPEPRTAEFRELREAFAHALAAPLSRITGADVRRVDMRAYAYRPGHYLLPHADHQEGLARKLAYAYYLPSPEPPEGGELELFDCTVDSAGAITATTSALVIEPRANRLVVFEVGDFSLHQVREVLAGLRIWWSEKSPTSITATTSALVIEPRANRLVVFEVGDFSLHQVREVLAGLRISLAGWFYP